MTGSRWKPQWNAQNGLGAVKKALAFGQSVVLDISEWERVFFRVISGVVQWTGREGFALREEQLREGDSRELFNFGSHTVFAATDCQFEICGFGERKYGATFFSQKEQAAARWDLSLHREATSDLNRDIQELRSRSLRTDVPCFMNQLFSGRTPEAEKASRLAYELRTTLATEEAAPAFAEVEREVVRGLAELCGWSVEEAQGLAVPGGSFGNFMAVHLARFRVAPEINENGTSQVRFGFFVSEDSHYSVEKAVVALGVGRRNLIAIPTRDGKVIPDDLRRAIDRFEAEGGKATCVIATAGTTVYGAFDNVSELADICTERNVWLHVDAAWGGPVLFSKKSRTLLAGIERADSMSIDAHKLLGASLTSTMFLTSKRGWLEAANAIRGGAYLFHEDAAPDPGRLSWQCGRGPDALQFWLLWKSLGSDAIGDFVDRQLALARWLQQRIDREARLRLMADAPYLNVCFQVLPPSNKGDVSAGAWTLHVRRELVRRNQLMVNYSQGRSGPFLRMVIAHPQLEKDFLEKILSDILAI